MKYDHFQRSICNLAKAAALDGWRLCFLTLLACAACSRSSQPIAQPSSQSTTPATQPVKYEMREFEEPRVSNPGYVGYQTCRECHAARVAECEPSSHFNTCRVPNEDRMPAAFASSDPNQRTLKLPNSGVTFEMEHRNGKYFQIAQPDGSDQRTVSTIDLVYGAKTTSDEVYLSWHADDSMRELPVAWIYAEDCWGAAGFDRGGGGDFARELTVRCFECHNTWFEHVPGSLGSYRREGLLMGVTCERCHGPAREHVDYHRQHPSEEKPHAILYPGSLERERLIEVCTQCHSNAIRHRGPALSFRPGEKLDEHYRLVTPKYDEDDHVANQIQPLRQSKCFQQSEMTCITCHDPHLTGAAVHGMTFQETCTQCHEMEACKKRPELPAAVANQCVECHMRRYSKINVNFDLVDDAYVPPLQRSNHEIRVDPVATKEVLLKWYRSQNVASAEEASQQLEQELLEHWFAEGVQRAQQGRYTAAVASMREALRVQPDSAEARRLADEYGRQQRAFDDLRSRAEHAMRENRDLDAIELFQQVLQVRPDDASAHGRLGTLYAKQGDRNRAEAYLGKVAELDPDEQYGWSMLAWLAFLDRDYSRAAEYYRQADAIEPFNSRINFLWAESLMQAGQPDAALQRYQIAVRSDPRNLDAVRALASVNLRMNALEAALEPAENAVRLTNHASPVDLMVLADVQQARGERQLAAQVVELAMEAAKRVEPQMLPEIRSWAQQRGLPAAAETR